MKKLMMVLVAFFMMGIAQGRDVTQDECVWSWWAGLPPRNVNKDLCGCSIGPAAHFHSVRGAELSLLYSNTQELIGGCQFALGYNHADKVYNGCQVGCVNVAESAALQFGLLCFNKNGFLPVFVLFNFDKTMFCAKE